MKEEKIIMYNDPEAASYGVFEVEGWKDSKGNIWKEEDLARYSGCTHKKCDKCEEIYHKNSFCHRCSEARMKEKYNKLKAVSIDFHGDIEWVYDDSTSTYHRSVEDLLDSYWDTKSNSFVDIDNARVHPCCNAKLIEIDTRGIIETIYEILDSDIDPEEIMPPELEEIIAKIEEYNTCVNTGDGIDNGMVEADMSHRIDITEMIEEYIYNWSRYNEN